MSIASGVAEAAKSSPQGGCGAAASPSWLGGLGSVLRRGLGSVTTITMYFCTNVTILTN